MSLQAGIVGLPNVGKSTLFNALTAAGADSANYPFCTIEPNTGIVPVPDPRLARIHTLIASQKILPAVVEIVDIAGLVRGASKGEGLGNQFLGHIRAVDAILHVVRCFIDEDITHVEGSIDPLRDIETIDLELIFADMASLERRMDRYRKLARGRDKEAAFHLAVAQKLMATLEDGKPVRAGDWTEEEWVSIKAAQLITSKPVLFVCNVDEDSVSGNDMTATVAEHAAAVGAGVVIISGQIEAEISEIEDPEDRQVFLEDVGLAEPGLALLARSTYSLLGMQTYFTAGPKEIRAWTIKVGDKAPQAAGVIHTDFERGFIRAEVYSIDDLEVHKTEAALKSAGKLRVEGKEYVVKDGDVMHFRFNV
ncbi:MAG: redox-regulated ATPase YchF [Myxococcota bacterium]|nr:redox-regulated ATPase YchF [Myxococcota bacterium]